MWELYDEMISGIPENFIVKDFVIGACYSYVETNYGIGIAKTIPGIRFPFLKKPRFGMPLKELAASIKSFHYVESSLALAAINAFYNTEEGLKTLASNSIKTAKTNLTKNFFSDRLLPKIRREGIALYGHFPFYEEQIPINFEYLVLEEYPEDGDYPVSALEYLFPSQKNIWLQGSSLTKKILPRILEICPDSNVLFLDIDIPITPILLKQNPGQIISLKITDKEQCAYHIKAGADISNFYEVGEIVCLKTII
jgi:uncharacterized protein